MDPESRLPGTSLRGTAWLVYRLRISRHPVGPALRVLRLASECVRCGFRVRLAVDSFEGTPPEGVEVGSLDASIVESLRPGDPVILSAYAPLEILRAVQRRRIPYHADLFNLTAVELLEESGNTSPARLASERRRRCLRYLALARSAERIYVSLPEQVGILAGLGLGPDPLLTPRQLSSLPSRAILLPMGCEDPSTFGKDFPDPYPENLSGKSLFLWGGGIWRWFDLDTLLEAFRILRDRGDDANHLFFLSGVDHKGDGYAAVLEEVKGKARRAGLESVNVHFNTKAVTLDELPAYLHWCRAGIMANPETLEAFQSWRTRFLDLLWASRPLVVAGSDPLGSRMAEAKAALVRPANDAKALADAIQLLGSDDRLHDTMCAAAGALGSSLRWERVLEPFRHAITAPRAFTVPSEPMPFSWHLRYVLDLALLRLRQIGRR